MYESSNNTEREIDLIYDFFQISSLVLFNPYLSNVPIFYPLKTPENFQLFSVDVK